MIEIKEVEFGEIIWKKSHFPESLSFALGTALEMSNSFHTCVLSIRVLSKNINKKGQNVGYEFIVERIIVKTL